MIEGLKPYAEYKESGLPWLGRCPKNWSVRRTKILFQERVQKGFPNEPLLAATQTKGVVKKEDYETRTVTAQKDLHLLKLVEVGDYVISLRSFQGGIEVAHCRGIISPAYTVLKPRKTATSGYYSHFFKAKPFIDSLSLFVTGIREGQNIDYERLSRAELPMPSEGEQAAIVRFLDHANRKIDGFIRAKRKLIGLLNEQKQAIIHRAVTRGLHPDVPLKPSGIPWLGDIPQHWEVWPLKRIGWFKSGAGFPVTEQGKTDLEVPFLKVSDMTRPGNEVWIESCNNTVSRDDADRLGAFVFPAGSIIFPKVGGAMLTNKRRLLKRPSCIDNNVMGCVVRRGHLEFVFLLLQQLDFGRLSKPGPVPAIGEGEVREIKVVFPPLDEQKAIVPAVEKEAAPLNTAIARTEREIALMQEYRTRLTADLVTGKLDVREAAAHLPAPPTDAAVEPAPDEPLEEIETEEETE